MSGLPDGLPTLRVLLVDDNLPFRELMAARLGQAGLAIAGTCDDLDQTVRLTAALRPDVILVERALSTTTARQVLTALSVAGLRVPVVVHAAWLPPTAREQLMAAGAHAVLPKDAPMAELLAALEHSSVASLRTARHTAPTARRAPRGAVSDEDVATGRVARLAATVMLLATLAVLGPQAASVISDAGFGVGLAVGGVLLLALGGLGLPLRATRRRLQAVTADRDAQEATVERMQGFLASAAHDLRTPAAVVAGFSSTLEDGWNDFDDDVRRDITSTVARSARRLAGLLDDLMTSAMADKGDLHLLSEQVDVAETVERAVLQSLAADKQVALVGVEGLVVLADSRALSRVLANLLDNAVKYGEAPFEVRASLSAGRVRLQVRDHGSGVDEDFVPHLFEAYAQSHEDSDQRRGGVGLGLSVVRSLATGMGVDLRYRADGPGATFELDLPTPAPTSASADAEPSGPPDLAAAPAKASDATAADTTATPDVTAA